MNKYKDISAFFTEKGPEEVERFVDKNLDISQQVYALLEEKGWSQKDLAQALGKTDAEVSKWLSGTHNLTLRSIARMETALEADIILTPQKASRRYKEVEYITFKVYSGRNHLFHEKLDYTPGLSRLKDPMQDPPKTRVA